MMLVWRIWNGSTNNPYFIFFSILITRLLDIELVV